MRACQYTKYTKEIKKEREHELYSYFIRYKYMFPYIGALHGVLALGFSTGYRIRTTAEVRKVA